MHNKSQPLTNDNAKLIPKTSFDVPVLEFDFPSLHVGVAAYEEGPTGCTVFYFPQGAWAAADIRGGLPGVIGDYERVHAICFAGGSLLGLEAAVGVTAEMFAMRDYSTRLPLVSGAIIWDLWRENRIYPDKDLGRAALKSARTGVFPLGRAGAGCSPGCGGLFGGMGIQGEGTGQGGAFRQVGATKVAVFTVVNALGAIVNRQGQVVRGYLDPQTGKRRHYTELLKRKLAQNETTEPPQGKNTTLTLVVTNQKLDPPMNTLGHLRQLARQVHSSMARAIQPFHTMSDGDVLFAVTTDEVENKPMNLTDLGVLASELAWDAVLNCFQHGAKE
jgi:L-aminopeptidase/D-esterase-like protein